MENCKSTDKFKYISSVLSCAKNSEDVLSDKNIDISSDFPFICLCSGNNYDMVIDTIAQIASNGDRAVIEENINLISMNMWKDLFNKNESIKNIFLDNFNKIFENTNVMTCTEVEAILNDKRTSYLVYSYIDDIIVKLNTQDRASLITELNERKNGASLIKQNIHVFFKKGTYGISTTYSKIMARLEKINGIEKIDILRACCDNFSDMISKATAFDDETIKLITWVNKALDETNISESERLYLNSKIERAIIENYDTIVEKTNCDIGNTALLRRYHIKRDSLNKNEMDELIENGINDAKEENGKERLNDIREETEDEKSVRESIKISKAKGKIEPTKKYELSNELISSYINRYNMKKNQSEEINNENVEEQDLQDKLQKLIYTNIHETDIIVDKVLNKKSIKENTKVASLAGDIENDSNLLKVEEEKNEVKLENKVNLAQENPIKTNEKIVGTDSPIIRKKDDVSHDPVKMQKSLVLVNPEAKRFLKKDFIKRIFKRVLKIFGYKKEKRKIDDVWS